MGLSLHYCCHLHPCWNCSQSPLSQPKASLDYQSRLLLLLFTAVGYNYSKTDNCYQTWVVVRVVLWPHINHLVTMQCFVTFFYFRC